MIHKKVDSSMLDRVGYDAKKRMLEVRFVKNASRYRYFEVPKEVYEQLLAADSKGRYMQASIIDHYRYEKVVEERQRS